MLDAINIWNNINYHLQYTKIKSYDYQLNIDNAWNTITSLDKKYLMKPLDVNIKQYNIEINEFITKLQNDIELPFEHFLLNDVYLGLYELYKDLKLLDKINNGYLFFDENKFDQRYMYYATINIFASIYSLNLIENKKSFSFAEIYRNNPLILFLLCCYVFLDNLLDSPDIDKTIKKSVTKYIDHLFKTGNILNEYCDLDLKYLSTINNIFSILLNYKLEEYPYLYQSMYKIFISEVKTSKYQTFEHKDDIKDLNIILNMTMDKGRETLIASWQIFYININFRSLNDLMILSSHMGFMFQLLDDLDDIDIDIKEKNVTIFSYPYLYELEDIDEYMKINVSKLINYVINISEEFKKINNEYVDETKKQQYAFAYLIYLNYCIAKNTMLKKMFADYEHCFPLKYDQIVEIYKQKQLLEFKYNILNSNNAMIIE